ncbi:MAG: carbohydrate kinase [Deltaproteobacteria bacterium]|nr:carbohydrate kinase [Deltaproteobacteria bacterium]MBI3386496.1 carbohydrate kinase [Deltaproteobacteria bacterium]
MAPHTTRPRGRRQSVPASRQFASALQRAYLRAVHVLAIDQGTSSTKALVVAPAGDILALAEVAVHPKIVDGGGVEQDPEELWASILTAGRQAVAHAAVPINAVGLANQGETILAWDRSSGAPLSTALSWQDRRATEVCERLRPQAESLRALTGLPLDPYFAAPKIAWLRAHVTRDGVCTTTDTWLLHRLTGAFVTDAATASRTLLMDLSSGRWSPRACSVFGVDPESLPTITGCAEAIGETSAFGATAPVAGHAVDQQAALFAQACFDRGEAKCTYGTGAFLLATTGAQPTRSGAGLATCVAWRLGGETTYCLDGQVYTVGAAVNWLQRIGVINDPSDLDSSEGDSSHRSDVVFVPALAGLAAPFWRPAARGSFVGLSLATQRGDLIRAVIDGIAAQVAWLARAAGDDLGRPLSRLRVDGGLTRSRVLMQTQADLLQIPIEVSASPHATALGVAALARLGVGGAKTPAEAVGRRAAVVTYEPHLSSDEAAARLRRWHDVATATMVL